MFKKILRLMYVLSSLVIIYFLWFGYDFYRTPYQERPFHSAYSLLKSGGEIGHGFGIIGSAMMVLMLLYSLRKRWKFMQGWGKLARWLDVHIFFGIIGPSLIILHSAFKVQGLISVSFWSMILVVLSGILGRYLYLKIPRDFSGEELTLNQIRQETARISTELRQKYGISQNEFDRFFERYEIKKLSEKNLIQLFFHLILFDVKKQFIRRQIKRWMNTLGEIPLQQQKQIIPLVWKKIQIEQRLLIWNKIHQIFHYWHVFHKPFAIIMYMIMLIHVGISLWLGYTWIF